MQPSWSVIVNQFLINPHRTKELKILPDLKNINSEESLKIPKTQSSVPFDPEADLDFQGHPNMLA